MGRAAAWVARCTATAGGAAFATTGFVVAFGCATGAPRPTPNHATSSVAVAAAPPKMNIQRRAFALRTGRRTICVCSPGRGCDMTITGFSVIAIKLARSRYV